MIVLLLIIPVLIMILVSLIQYKKKQAIVAKHRLGVLNVLQMSSIDNNPSTPNPHKQVNRNCYVLKMEFFPIKTFRAAVQGETNK